MGHVTIIAPILGMICQLGLTMFNLHTKFEFSISTHYEDMKGAK